MNDPSILIFFIIAIISVIIAFVKTTQFERRIAREIESKRFTPISISRRWFDFDEGTASFDVIYQDSLGLTHETRCKIRSFMLFFDGDIYWTRPLVDHNRERQDRVKHDEGRTFLIDTLRKENKELKERIKELEARLV